MIDDRSTPIASPLSLHELRQQLMEVVRRIRVRVAWPDDQDTNSMWSRRATAWADDIERCLVTLLDHEHAQGEETRRLRDTLEAVNDSAARVALDLRQQIEAHGQEIARLKQELATRETAAPDATEGTNEAMRAALQRIVDWSDCQCEHEDDDCCANCADTHFHCPGCIAAKALSPVAGEAPKVDAVRLSPDAETKSQGSRDE